MPSAPAARAAPVRHAIRRLGIENYRSIRGLDIELAPLTVVSGANGVGKSNLYRGLELLSAAARGDLSRRLAQEGGMRSAYWAGQPWRADSQKGVWARPPEKGPVRIRLFAEIEDLDYALELGLPQKTDAALGLDPVVKSETLRAIAGKRRPVLAERKGPALSARGESGRLEVVGQNLWLFETALSAHSSPSSQPELDRARRVLSALRFYHQFRVDPDSPLRRPQPAIMTPSVASDGSDWAPALASLMRIEQRGFPESDAAKAVAQAFPGGEIEIRDGESEIGAALQTAEFERPFDARELSDGTLRYLVLTAALCAARPPPFMALNEPESSLHSSLIEPLADMIGRAAERTQILVVTHAAALADRLSVEHGAKLIRLEKVRGETRVAE